MLQNKKTLQNTTPEKTQSRLNFFEFNHKYEH